MAEHSYFGDMEKLQRKEGVMANARMRNKAEDFERMGVDQKIVASWEDGKRNGAQPGWIEWWYFDADLDDGTKVNLNFATNPVIGSPEEGLHPFFYANVQFPDGHEINDFAFLDEADCSFSEERCDVKIGPHTFRGDLETYQVHVEDVKGISLDLVLKKTAASWRPGTAYVDFGEDYESYFTWLCAVPRGDVSGTLVRDGQTRQVRGRGYHDHQWATGLLLNFWNRWLWGRQQSDGYTILVFDSVSNDATGNVRFPWFCVQDAQGNVVFDNVEMGPGVDIRMDGEFVLEQTGKTLPSHMVYRFERDGVKVRYELTELRFLVGNDQYAMAPAAIQAAFRSVGAAPSISRHAAIGKLTIERPDEDPLVVEGEMHYELSSQYREFIVDPADHVTERDSAAKLPLVPQPEWFEAPVATTGPAASDIDEGGEPDPGLAGSWDCTFEGPMGKSNMKLVLEVDGTTLGGHMEILRKKQPVQWGIVTADEFEATALVKVAFRKAEARIKGTRDGDSIRGTVELPTGLVTFEGTRG